MTKEQTSIIIGAVISLIITVLGVFGYNVMVSQPQFAAIEQTQQKILGVVVAGQGEQGITGQDVTGFNSVNVSNDLAVGDDATIAGDLTVANQIVEMTTTERLQIAAPTAQPTATPGLRINVAGVNEPLLVQAATTPVARLNRLGVLTLGRGVIFGDQSAVTVTNGGTIAVTDDFVPLTAAGAVGTGTITGCNTLGKVTYLYNTANQTITITDTGTLKLGGNAALGQYDSLALLGDGTNCVQVAKTDN